MTNSILSGGGGGSGWKKKAVGKAGGGEGQMEQRGAVAGQIDREEPQQ